MMSNKSTMMNRLALVLVSIIVLDLVFTAHQVESIKAIKKKLLVKKLKKLLPLLAIMKPKKKIILLPIPIPMYGQDQGMESFGMDTYDMAMDMQTYSPSSGDYSSGSSSSSGL